MPYIRNCWLGIISIILCFSSFGLAQDKPSADGADIEKLVEAITAAKTEDERIALLADKKELLTVDFQRALVKEGIRLYSEGYYPQAFTIIQLAKNIAEQIKDKAGVALALCRMAEVYRLQGDYKQSMEYFQKGLVLSEEINDKVVIGIALNGIGIIHGSKGNYGQSLDFFQRSLALREEIDDKAGIILTKGNIGAVYSFQGNYGQALEYYEKSLKLSEEIDDKTGIARAIINFGETHRLQGDFNQALEYFQKSLDMYEQLKEKANIAMAMSNIGLINISQGNYNQALKHLRKSLALREELKDKAGVARTLSHIASSNRLQSNYEQALEFTKQAAVITEQIGDLELLWQIYLTEGVAYRALNRPNESRQALEKAISVIEKIRSQIAGGERAQQLFFEGRVTPYRELVNLLISQNSYSEALTFAERAKARVILDVLQGGKIDITRALSPQEQEQEKTLKTELASLNAQIYREKRREQIDSVKLSDLESRLETVRLELEAFQTGLYAAHPELKAKRVEVQPITLEEAGALLPDANSALLEFVVGEEKTHLFVITQEQKSVNLKVYTLEIKREELTKRVERFRQMLADKDLGFRKPGRELYDLLLRPAQQQLRGKTTLIIVPEGVLWDLPFQVLQPVKSRYLLQDSTIFYTPSLTALREMQKPHSNTKENRKASGTLLALGNPALGNQSVRRVSMVLLGERLEPLPGAEAQVKRLARLYGLSHSRYYIGVDAREQQVKSEAGNYRILQFATHGILNNASPMYSHLVLSQVEQNSSEDGLLEAWEIMQMDLNAEMAVLAACETARGRVGAGEGMIGLSWALFVAGCPTTVVSQWKVEDSATKNLMLEFHRILKSRLRNPGSGVSKAEALRMAALKMMRTMKEPHPFYWAGFVLVGNGR
jgi:CHAT domain-containing protein